MWQNVKLDRPKSRIAQSIESIVRWAVIAVLAVCVSALGGFWWLVDGMSLGEGTLVLVGITAFSFNRVPEAGWAWFLEREVLFLRLPIWLVNVVGYTLGFWLAT